MSTQSKSALVCIALLVTGLVGLFAFLLHGRDIAVLSPAGPIAAQQLNLLIVTTLLMLIVVIPVFILTFFIAWKYREGNTNAKYTPDWDHNKKLEFTWWGVPMAIIAVLAVITWVSSHELDPYRPIASAKRPVTVQVVALEWKWLFLYPDQGIASVNYLRFPEETPINFEITADAPMNSFWIPKLGGQVYAMSGMTTKLHLLADKPGIYYGTSANLSGEGYADMNFRAQSTSYTAFEDWVQNTKTSKNHLSADTYTELAEPSKDHEPTVYASYEKGLYDTILMKYMTAAPDKQSGGHQHEVRGNQRVDHEGH